MTLFKAALTRIPIIIGLPELLPGLIAPEAERNRRVRSWAYQLTRDTRVFDVVTSLVEDLHFHAQCFTLDLYGPFFSFYRDTFGYTSHTSCMDWHSGYPSDPCGG